MTSIAYPLERWSQGDRTMLRTDSTPDKNSWKKFVKLGVDLDQFVMGNDGNKFSHFTGKFHHKSDFVTFIYFVLVKMIWIMVSDLGAFNPQTFY